MLNICSEYITRRVLNDWNGGVRIGGRRMLNFRYAVGTLLIANNPEELCYINLKISVRV